MMSPHEEAAKKKYFQSGRGPSHMTRREQPADGVRSDLQLLMNICVGLQADLRLMKTKALTGAARLHRQLTQLLLQMIPQLPRCRQLLVNGRRLCARQKRPISSGLQGQFGSSLASEL